MSRRRSCRGSSVLRLPIRAHPCHPWPLLSSLRNQRMNPGILLKSARELAPATLFLGLALFVVEAILAYVLPTFAQQLVADLTAMPFIQNIFKALVGTEITGAAGPEIFTAVAWVHPVALALVWAHATIA